MAAPLNHFSHGHLLVLTPSTELNLNGVRCSLCSSNRPTDKAVYACRSCQYFLHPRCTRLEYQTYIVAHDDHLSTLITSPPQESTLCKACGGKISRCRYSCNTCRYDVHVTCAQAGKTIRVEDHEHPLCLHFPRPQDNGARHFNCSRCGKGDQGFWGYTCKEKPCPGYYLHLDCNVFRPPPSSGPGNPVGNGTSNADVTSLQNKVQNLESQLQGQKVMTTALAAVGVTRLVYNIGQELVENEDRYRSILDEIEKEIEEDVDSVFGSIGETVVNFGEDLVDTVEEFAHNGVDVVEHVASTGAELAVDVANFVCCFFSCFFSCLFDFVCGFFSALLDFVCCLF